MSPDYDQSQLYAVPRRRTLGFGAMALLGGFAILSGYSTEGHSDSAFQNWSLRPMCVLWDGQASKAMVLRVTESRDDVDLRRVGDDIFRMRRARRSCDIGRIRMACQDYLAIIRNVGGISSEWQGSASVCPLAMEDEPSGSVRQFTRQAE